MFLGMENNKGMGGVDLSDQSVNNYRIAIRDKKWYWPLITSALNISFLTFENFTCLPMKKKWIYFYLSGMSTVFRKA